MSLCAHMSFEAKIEVNRFEDTGKFSADIRIHCTECREPFRFLGLPAGLLVDRPSVSAMGLELRAPIEPQGVPTIATSVRFELSKIPEKA